MLIEEELGIGEAEFDADADPCLPRAKPKRDIFLSSSGGEYRWGSSSLLSEANGLKDPVYVLVVEGAGDRDMLCESK